MLPKIEKDGLLSAWEPDYFCFQTLSVDGDKSNCGGVGGESSEMRTAAYKGRGCHTAFVHTRLHYLFMFLVAWLSYVVLYYL